MIVPALQSLRAHKASTFLQVCLPWLRTQGDLNSLTRAVGSPGLAEQLGSWAGYGQLGASLSPGHHLVVWGVDANPVASRFLWEFQPKTKEKLKQSQNHLWKIQACKTPKLNHMSNLIKTPYQEVLYIINKKRVKTSFSPLQVIFSIILSKDYQEISVHQYFLVQMQFCTFKNKNGLINHKLKFLELSCLIPLAE